MALDQISEDELNKAAQMEEESAEDEMSFIDHLEILRWHLIRGLIAIVVFTILAFMNTKYLFETVVLGPSKSTFWTYQQMCHIAEWVGSSTLCIGVDIKLINIHLGGQFFMHISASVVMGLVAAFPYVFWEIWRFIKPGLYNKEKRVAQGATFFVSLLFMTGVLFGYFVVAPLSINFLASYDLGVTNQITLTNFVSTVTTLVLACGVLFQLPLVSYFLAKVGILTPEFMKSYRRHAFVIILILSAILTPPDFMSQVIIALPLSGLYEVSIWIVASVVRKQEAELAS